MFQCVWLRTSTTGYFACSSGGTSSSLHVGGGIEATAVSCRVIMISME
jgi:hypothetical protein